MAPTLLHALRDDLRALEVSPAAREPLEPERAAELYPLVGDVRENDPEGRADSLC